METDLNCPQCYMQARRKWARAHWGVEGTVLCRAVQRVGIAMLSDLAQNFDRACAGRALSNETAGLSWRSHALRRRCHCHTIGILFSFNAALTMFHRA